MLEAPAADNDHTWVGAVNAPLDIKMARHAARRGSVRIRAEIKVQVLEVYCEACKRPYDDVLGQPCQALINNEHLRGGPIGERKKRTGLVRLSQPTVPAQVDVPLDTYTPAPDLVLGAPST